VLATLLIAKIVLLLQMQENGQSRTFSKIAVEDNARRGLPTLRGAPRSEGQRLPGARWARARRQRARRSPIMRPMPRDSRRLSRRLLGAALAGGLLLAAPLAAHAGGSHHERSSAYGWSGGEDGDRFAWGLFDPEDGHSTMDTDGDDWREIRRLLREEDQPVFWFRLDGRNYVVRDPAVVARVSERVEPIRELGRKQGILGGKQGALGERQGRLGREQAALGAQQARLGAKLARLAYLEEDDDRATRRERREIETAMRELGQRQAELGREQTPLGRLQADLGREQAEMGREQRRLSMEVGAELRELAEMAVRTGKATPVKSGRSM